MAKDGGWVDVSDAFTLDRENRIISFGFRR